MTEPVRVFVSYSREGPAHSARCLALANRLCEEGLEAWIDAYEPNPSQGWPRWTQQQITEAKFVILVCTPTFRRRFEGNETADTGHGATWEGLLAQQMIHDSGSRNKKFLPVLFEGETAEAVPAVLQPFSRYTLYRDYNGLYRQLTGQPAVLRPERGSVLVMPPIAPPDPAEQPKSEALDPPGAGWTSATQTGPSLVAIGHLPQPASLLVGRAAGLAQLDAAWAEGPERRNVLVFVAWGGTGKTSLVTHWLADLAREKYRGARRVLGWSFYNQGTNDEHAASADEFMAWGLFQIGDPNPSIGSPFDKAERLAKLVKRARWRSRPPTRNAPARSPGLDTIVSTAHMRCATTALPWTRDTHIS